MGRPQSRFESKRGILLAGIRAGGSTGNYSFQIDDGWQTGKSPNSAVAKGSFKDIWSNPDYWTPDKSKYPRGLSPIIKRGKELGIDIALWFNPSIQDNFADWKRMRKLLSDYIKNMASVYLRLMDCLSRLKKRK